LGGLGPRIALRVVNHGLEVRPRLDWNKGAALTWIQEKLNSFDICICIGDDRTDEAMFRCNSNGFNIRVRKTAPSAASYYLFDPSEVAFFLNRVLEIHEFGRFATHAHGACASEAEGATALPYFKVKDVHRDGVRQGGACADQTAKRSKGNRGPYDSR